MRNDMSMGEHYFDHDADVGIIGRGQTLEACFADTALAMFALICDLSEVNGKQTIHLRFEEADIELALVTWLNCLLAESNARNYTFSHFKISRQGDQWLGEASGEAWRDNMTRGTDVKGATLTMLSVKNINAHWEARCVVDV